MRGAQATHYPHLLRRPGRRITARLVFARPPYADAPLWNAGEPRRRLFFRRLPPNKRGKEPADESLKTAAF